MIPETPTISDSENSDDDSTTDLTASEAICIQFKLDRKWYKVGYVIHEALSDLHTALRESKVTKVSIDWIKYIIYWRTPGWYTGINITRIGEWSSTVVQSQSRISSTQACSAFS